MKQSAALSDKVTSVVFVLTIGSITVRIITHIDLCKYVCLVILFTLGILYDGYFLKGNKIELDGNYFRLKEITNQNSHLFGNM